MPSCTTSTQLPAGREPFGLIGLVVLSHCRQTLLSFPTTYAMGNSHGLAVDASLGT